MHESNFPNQQDSIDEPSDLTKKESKNPNSNADQHKASASLPFKKRHVLFSLENVVTSKALHDENPGPSEEEMQATASSPCKKRFSRKKVVTLEALYNEKPTPSEEEMRKIAKNLNETYERIKQWFRDYPQRIKKAPASLGRKKRHVLFSPENVVTLKALYDDNARPSEEKMREIAKNLNETYERIKQWFRDYPQRIKKAPASLGRKKRHVLFSPENVVTLKALYDDNARPSEEKMREIAKNLNETYERIKQWFRDYPQRIKKATASLGREKRHVLFSPENVVTLKALYDDNATPSEEKMREIAKDLNESYERIQKWYHNWRTEQQKAYGSLGRKKRQGFTWENVETLNKLYDDNPRPSAEEMRRIAKNLDETYERIQRWFINHSQRIKKDRPIRNRTFISHDKRRILEAHFAREHYPDQEQVVRIINETNLPKKTIRYWFYNERRKKEPCISK